MASEVKVGSFHGDDFLRLLAVLLQDALDLWLIASAPGRFALGLPHTAAPNSNTGSRPPGLCLGPGDGDGIRSRPRNFSVPHPGQAKQRDRLGRGSPHAAHGRNRDLRAAFSRAATSAASSLGYGSGCGPPWSVRHSYTHPNIPGAGRAANPKATGSGSMPPRVARVRGQVKRHASWSPWLCPSSAASSPRRAAVLRS